LAGAPLSVRGRDLGSNLSNCMRPNILFILTDQFRADALGCVGGWVRTPNLDAIAARGSLFTNAFANSPECVPSRISLATGLYPHQTGVDRNCACTLDPETPNWMKAVADAGYQTSLFGKTHLHPHTGDLRERLPLMHRYGLQVVDETTGPRAAASVVSNMTVLWDSLGHWDAYKADLRERFAAKPHAARPTSLPLPLYYDRYVADAARRHLESLPRERPWFCWVSFGGPHEPWDAPEPYASMYDPRDMPAPSPRIETGELGGLLQRAYGSSRHSPALTDGEIAEMRANYAGSVTLIDDEIGRVIELLRERGDLERTAIVFTSDHGEMNGDHRLIYKSNFLDPAIKVPLIVVPPGGGNAGRCGWRSTAIVELMDVGATMLDFAAAEVGRDMQSRSLGGVIEGRLSEHRSVAVSEYLGHACVVSERYKAEFDERGAPTLLFDRQEDRQEQRNLVRDDRYSETLLELLGRYHALRETSPPVTGVVCAEL
jgi:arylsulfatase